MDFLPGASSRKNVSLGGRRARESKSREAILQEAKAKRQERNAATAPALPPPMLVTKPCTSKSVSNSQASSVSGAAHVGPIGDREVDNVQGAPCRGMRPFMNSVSLLATEQPLEIARSIPFQGCPFSVHSAASFDRAM